MKKTLIALAAVAVSSAAMAQATITGGYSVSYQQDLTSTAANGALVTVNSARGGAAVAAAGAATAKGLAVTDAFVRIAAAEDLGGGMRAAGDFTLETGAFRGAHATRADSGISLSGGFGTVAFRNTRDSDLLTGITSPAISLPDNLYGHNILGTQVARDTLSYTLPTLVKGLTLGLGYVEGNDGNINLPTAATVFNKAQVYSAQYVTGPLTVRAQVKRLTLNPSTTINGQQSEYAVVYNAGFATLGYAFDDKTTTTGSTATGYSITVPMGAVTLGAQQFERGAVKASEFGVKYDLSKRTSIAAARGTIAGSTTNGTQFRVRIGHNF